MSDTELGRLVPQHLKGSEQRKRQWRNDVGVPIVTKVVRFSLGLPSLNKFPVLHKAVDIMLVLRTSGCYENDFVPNNFSVTLCKVVVCGVIAVRIHCGHRGVSSSCLLASCKITSCKETMSTCTRLDVFSMTSMWQSQCEVGGHWRPNMRTC